MTQTGAECFVGPVVRRIVVVSVAVTRSGIGIELAVETDEVLTIGHAKSALTQSTPDAVIGIAVGCEYIAAKIAIHVASGIERAIERLEVFAGIGDNVVIAQGTRVATPASVKSDLRSTFFTFLGGNHDDTIGAASTIEGCRSGILEHGDALDIAGGDVAHRAVIGETVDHIKRSCGTVDRADAADEHARTYAGLAVGRHGLHTGHLTGKCIGDIGHKSVLQLVGLNYGSRTGVLTLFLTSVCHNNHFVKHGSRGRKMDCHVPRSNG